MDLCREAKERKRITAQELADETGISISTINNYFASASKAPSVYNAGMICAVLGVSMDGYFGIEPEQTAEERLQQAMDNRAADIRAARLEGGMEQLSGAVKEHKAQLHNLRVLLFTVCALFTVVLLVVAWYVLFDYEVPNRGLIQGGETGVFAWAIILLLAVCFVVIILALVSAARYTKNVR